jgi:hypothetical protein
MSIDIRSYHPTYHSRFETAIIHMRQKHCTTVEARFEGRSLDLFSQAGVSLPIIFRPIFVRRFSSWLSDSCSTQPYLQLVATYQKVNIPSRFYQVQFSFDFAALPPFRRTRPSVIHLVPRSRAVYLNCGVYDIFRDLPDAADAALRLEANGIWMLGFLVQMSEHDVQRLGSVDKPTLEAMKHHLSKIGMSFETRIPWWNRDNRVLVNASRAAVQSCLARGP